MKVLIAGESYHSYELHVKGFDVFSQGVYHTGVQWLKPAIEGVGAEVVHLKNHDVGLCFPSSLEGLQEYDTIYLSDIGSGNILLHPDTYYRSRRTPNRLKLLKEYVANGGGLCMIGGYVSFQGIGGRSNWRNTPVAEVLPVIMEPGDDREETPEGATPEVVDGKHPILQGVEGEWPWVLGFNRTEIKPDATLVMEINGHPFLAVQEYGKGRTAAFTTDCAPHWSPHEFLEWEHYPTFWGNLTKWLSGQIG